MLAAGGQLAHLPEPHAQSLETDLGTVIKLLNIYLYQYLYLHLYLHAMWPTNSSAQEVNIFSSSNVSFYTILCHVLDSEILNFFFLFISKISPVVTI